MTEQRCPEQACMIPHGNHRHHWDGDTWWPNTGYVPPPPKPERKRRGKSRATPEARSLMLDVRDRTQGRDRSQEWTKETWLEHAREVMEDFLAQRGDAPFTTPEDLWPLLPDPAPISPKVLSALISSMLRVKRIEQVGVVRLGGQYHTRDGTELRANKNVPIYAGRV